MNNLSDSGGHLGPVRHMTSPSLMQLKIAKDNLDADLEEKDLKKFSVVLSLALTDLKMNTNVG